jgi:hypothetical protein
MIARITLALLCVLFAFGCSADSRGRVNRVVGFALRVVEAIAEKESW